MTNLDVHVYRTRDGLYRARCSGAGVVMYGQQWSSPEDAAAAAIRCHARQLTAPQGQRVRGSSAGVERRTSTPLAPRGDGTNSRSTATTSSVAPDGTRPDRDSQEALPISPGVSPAAAATGERGVLRGAAETEDRADLHALNGVLDSALAGEDGDNGRCY